MVFLSSGKIKQLINLDLYSDISIAQSIKNLVNEDVRVKDLVRARSDTYWKANLNSFPHLNIRKIKAAFTIEVGKIETSLEEDDDNLELFSQTTQELKLIANKELFKVKTNDTSISLNKYNPEYWKIFISGLPNLSPFKFNPQKPHIIDSEELPKQNNPIDIVDKFKDLKTFNANVQQKQSARPATIDTTTEEAVPQAEDPINRF